MKVKAECDSLISPFEAVRPEIRGTEVGEGCIRNDVRYGVEKLAKNGEVARGSDEEELHGR